MSAAAALPQPGARRPAPPHLRRVPTTRENSDLAVGGALPDGHERPATQGRWRSVLRASLGPGQFRADRRTTLLAVATTLMNHTDWDTGTSRPTWAVLIDRCQRITGRGSRSTIARAIATLIKLKLIARIAGGRIGCYTPDGCRARSDSKGPCLHPEGRCAPHEAAVYVLIVPTRLRSVPNNAVVEAASAVDGNDTPPPREVSVAHPVRAHARQKTQSEPLRGTHHEAPAQAPATQVIPNRHDPLWPARATTGSQGARFAASVELQRRLPVLRQISTRDVRSCLREFFLAGWTVQDIEHALDWRPDGTRWPHDGADGIGPYRVRGWLAHRLKPWTTDGTPRRSFTQQADADRAHRRAVDQARREREQAERATHPPVPATSNAAYQAMKTHLRHINRGAAYLPDCPACRTTDETECPLPLAKTSVPAPTLTPTVQDRHTSPLTPGG